MSIPLFALASLVPFVLAIPQATTDSFGSGPHYTANGFTATNLATLNSTVSGRLFQGTPFGRPCYSDYQGPAGDDTSPVNTALCQERLTNSGVDGYREGVFGSYDVPLYEECSELNKKCSINLADTNMDSQQPFSAPGSVCYQGAVPSYYIDVQGASDVQAAFQFVKQAKVPFVVKNTGHDSTGRSARPGALAVWTHHLKSINRNTSFRPDGCPLASPIDAVTVGAGVQFSDTFAWADANHVTILGGACTGVGNSGGWMMGGGIGALTNYMGLGADRVHQLKVVTPDGVLRTVNACQNQDLFFAMRGGGPGTYGVILETTIKLEPEVPIQVIFSFFNANPTTTSQFYEILIDNALQWADQAWGGYVFANAIAYLNPVMNNADATTSMQPLLTFLNGLPAGTLLTGPAQVITVPSFLAFENGILGPALSGPPSDTYSVTAGRLLQTRNFATAAARAQTLSTLTTLINGLQPNQQFVIQTAPHYWGQHNPVAAAAAGVHPAWRKAIWYPETMTSWPRGGSAAQISAAYLLATQSINPLRAITPNVPGFEGGEYINEGDPHSPNWKSAFFGSHYPALLAIKNKYDPTDIMHCWECVGWKGPGADDYKCYVPSA